MRSVAYLLLTLAGATVNGFSSLLIHSLVGEKSNGLSATAELVVTAGFIALVLITSALVWIIARDLSRGLSVPRVQRLAPWAVALVTLGLGPCLILLSLGLMCGGPCVS